MRLTQLRAAVANFASCALFAATASWSASAAANNVAGAWSPVKPWPLISVHAVLTPDGRVLTYGTKGDSTQTGYFIYDVWDPSAGLDAGHLTLPNSTGTDVFCSSQLVLPQGGSVFIAGGDNWTGTNTTNTGNNNSNLFDLNNNTLTRNNNLNRARWYSSSTTLLNGEVYIQGGAGGTDRPEVREIAGAFRLLSGADTSAYHFMYPRNFIAPDGRVFGYDSSGKMYYIDTAGNGAVSARGQFSGPTGDDASAAMFRPGRILQFGGASSGARVIDITSGSPVVTTTQSLSSQRRLVNATVLADGKVLATGGSAVWNQLTDVNNSAEIWDPATGQWTRGPNGDRARLYHSVALLMPDASVLVGGGGAGGNAPQNNTNIEVYYPPYLYDAAGGPAARAAIEAAPGVIGIGETFAVDFSSASDITRVVMVKTSSVTHSWNMDQRFVELIFARNGSRLMVQAPTKAADAPPGFYMLFLLDEDGTPSVARILKVNVAANLNPTITPTLANPGAQSTIIGTPASLQLVASDPNGDTLGYGASGLPPGVALDPLTGIISGTPTALGSFNVVVAASDGLNSDTESFVWTISPAESFVLEPPTAPAPQTSGTDVSFQANATGGSGVRYQWDFDDGTPATAWSSSGSISHRFARPGIYYVTVTVTDDSGVTQLGTVVQRVHLPLTANRPNASSNLALENRASGSGRLWVANADNDSVSVFDTASQARVAEITVGAGPRTLAIAGNGEIWVSNKHSASLSVIDPATLAVTRTINLPFASQPYGMAMAPGGGAVYVALEAAGRLLKLDPATYAIVANIGVGANPRHVSVNSDGSRVYVARFITPPLPGEHSATVQTEVDGMARGGEIVVVNAATMSLADTVILRHSEVLDSENQGRGIPNYLGAMSISPDGQSAWVPSKQDNIKRGTLRNGLNLNFQNTVRAISSRVDLATHSETQPARLDHDNAGLATAVAFDPLGVYMFVALETSREVAVIDAHGQWQIFRLNTGRAPQGLVVSPDGKRLYVSNFTDRTVSVFDIATLLETGVADVPLLATLASVSSERLSAQVLRGKQLFYDAKDPRLARDGYISCAACHNDGGQDGRVWDITGFGEGLRNTVNLRGRAAGHGALHWSNNFDEVHDFEGQIRTLAGGTGLMADADFNAGTRSEPLGDAKAGFSSDLDALAAYVASLDRYDDSPLRDGAGNLTAEASAGRDVFRAKNCAGCHGGTAFTISNASNPQNIGTIKAESGQRLGGALSGIDVPTLRDVWATAPYLHDGSAATIEQAIRAHSGITVSDTEAANLAAYVAQIGSQEASAPANPQNAGTGLIGRYFNNMTLSGTPVLQRTEAVNFNWGSGSAGTGVNKDRFSVRWSGTVEASASGTFRFQSRSDDGVRIWVNGVRIINNWTNHAATTNTSGNVTLVAGQRYSIVMEFYENGGQAVAQLLWRTPGSSSYVTIPASRLYAN